MLQAEMLDAPPSAHKARTTAAKLRFQWYAWDAHSSNWSGPDTVQLPRNAARHLTRELRDAPGRSWFGPLICKVEGEPEHRMFALMHDLKDCAVGLLYCEESKAGPLEIAIIIPASRRRHLRPDFGFEALAFTTFLGVVPPGTELDIQDGITSAIDSADGSESLVFSISTGLWPRDYDLALSLCTETIAAAAMHWLGAA